MKLNHKEDYFSSKNELDIFMYEKIKGHILHSKCQWYEDVEKYSKFVLNLEKKTRNTRNIKMFYR